MNSRRIAAGSAAFLLAALIAPGVALSQAAPSVPSTFHTSSFLGVGLVGNAPSATVGVSATLIRRQGFGLYADGRLSIQSPGQAASFMPGITAEEAERRDRDEWLREQETWVSGNLAAVRPVTADVAFYVGAGYAHRTTYVEFFDETRRRGDAGYYWVEDVSESGSTVNLLGGMIVQAGRNLLFQAGVDLAPRGFTLGAMYAFPRR
jgi:hypothetical protein